ncbi:hypothetical protein LuPra_05447 [Luteitalea pratensis]|uniref:DUF3500 domain-containing protein n=1 Tax=Luteitalea pratensis TaxID=1855912 RepID=A0A143PWG8_LUTPR|nr:DUF3500 domain-containing protein [Luteitalea pratensis]AMY12174.1 hypothetical protein LuPra_05447 [Luteitalea pratensis]
MRALLVTALLIGAAAAAATSRPSTAQPATSGKASPAVTNSTVAAEALVAALSGPAKDKGVLPLDHEARTTLNYIPIVRAGVPLEELTDPQKAQALSLLRSGLSESGFATARSIIAHEDILREIEKGQGVANYMRRQPGLYYTAVFGAPSSAGYWAWRFEGHHLSVNATHLGKDGDIVAPLFFGSNPAKVLSGPSMGLRILKDEEDEARALMALFSAEQKTKVVIAPETTNDIVTTNKPKAEIAQFDGVAAGAMTAPQKAQLRKLLEVYASRFPAPQRSAQLARIEKAGFDKLYFAWAGSLEVGKKHYYRIHGPSVLIEYDNSQNDANHIHSMWRDPEHDFGGDLLRKHLASVKHD